MKIYFKYMLLVLLLVLSIGSSEDYASNDSYIGYSSGSFSWKGIKVDYKKTGGLTYGGSTATPSKSGDFEIVGFGASHGSGTGNVNTYFNKSKMESQGFKAIAVRGLDDRKAEMWIRKNSGQTNIDIPSRARAYIFLVLDGNDIKINRSYIATATIDSSGSSYRVPNPDGSNLQILCYFSDDSVELTNVGNGKIIYQKWGFGDGDGFAMVLYAPGISPPSSISVNNHAPGGRQYVGIGAHFNKL
jgi:hypothetical protein